MPDKFVNRVPFHPIQSPDVVKKQREESGRTEKDKFQQIFLKELDNLKFSKHAQQRLADRNINLNDADMVMLTEAVERAGKKGAKDSLILLRNLAFVVNIKNKTVVTAIEEEQMKESVITNIDSAVIVDNKLSTINNNQ